MKHHVLLICLLPLLVLIGCTACDNNQNTLDLTYEVELLTATFGWTAQQPYKVTNSLTKQEHTLSALECEKVKETLFVHLLNEKFNQFDVLKTTMKNKEPIILEHSNLGIYELKITATEDSEPVLTLTNTETRQKMFFSLTM